MKNNRLLIFIVVIGVLLYFMMRSRNGNTRTGKTTAVFGNDVTQTSYPLEEVHETGRGGTMWVSFVKETKDGQKIRPSGDYMVSGDTLSISNTNSALDGSYQVLRVWNDTDGRLGAVEVDIPSGYNFNYTATQGGNPRDISYFGIGQLERVN